MECPPENGTLPEVVTGSGTKIPASGGFTMQTVKMNKVPEKDKWGYCEAPSQSGGVLQDNESTEENISLLRDIKYTKLNVHGTVRGATKDMGKMLGGDEEKDPDAAKKEEERQEALRQEEEERKAKYAKMEAEREVMRQGIRDKYGIKKKEEKEAEAQAALEANAEGSLTRPKKAIPPGCGDEEEEEEESILDTVIKYLPGPLQDMFKK
ncbi:complexin-1 [Egretta garzetta]|uniref:complexin-1 n=1 Tax=Egretta garzetta TaxID=188379 RepID=UPI00051F0B5F|nr:complexin-1 [Egretta garzetta]